MDAFIMSALSALTGAAVGGLTSGIANWLNHRSQVRAQWLLHEKSNRQTLYKDFIMDLQMLHLMRSSTMKPTFPAWSAFMRS
jgi:hypothetical protein